MYTARRAQPKPYHQHENRFYGSPGFASVGASFVEQPRDPRTWQVLNPSSPGTEDFPTEFELYPFNPDAREYATLPVYVSTCIASGGKKIPHAMYMERYGGCITVSDFIAYMSNLGRVDINTVNLSPANQAKWDLLACGANATWSSANGKCVSKPVGCPTGTQLAVYASGGLMPGCQKIGSVINDPVTGVQCQITAPSVGPFAQCVPVTAPPSPVVTPPPLPTVNPPVADKSPPDRAHSDGPPPDVQVRPPDVQTGGISVFGWVAIGAAALGLGYLAFGGKKSKREFVNVDL